MMYAQFRAQYPMGSLTSELLQAHEGNYVVRAVVQVGSTTLATGLSAAPTIEQAEDRARARALIVLGIELPTYEPRVHLMDATESQASAHLPPSALELSPARADAPEMTAWEALESLPSAKSEGSTEPTFGRTVWPEVSPSEPQQSDLTSSPAPADRPADLSEVIAQTDVELKRLRWTTAKGRKYLEQVYGKRSRQHLTDDELLEFLHYLQSLPAQS